MSKLRILVVQESDWAEVGPHDTHHLLERMSAEGYAVKVIDHRIRWKGSQERRIISRRVVREHFHKAVPDGDISVTTPAFVRAPFADMMSIPLTHYLEIKRQIRQFRPNIIIGLGLINTNIALRLAKKNGVPFIYYVLDELHQMVPNKEMRGLAKRVEKKNLRDADMVIATNQAMRDYCIGMGAAAEKTTIMKHGVEFSKYQSADGGKVRKELGLRDDDTVLFFMGWLYTFSGLDVVAREIARSDDPHLKLLIVGNGELWESLQSIRKEDKIGGRIITVGKKPYSEVADYVAAADICLLPALNNRVMENIVPIKIIEYMAANKPVIASELPGLVKEFGYDGGITFIRRPEDTISAAYAMKEKNDLVALGKIASRSVKGNAWDVLYGEFESLLQGLAKKGAASAR